LYTGSTLIYVYFARVVLVAVAVSHVCALYRYFYVGFYLVIVLLPHYAAIS